MKFVSYVRQASSVSSRWWAATSAVTQVWPSRLAWRISSTLWAVLIYGPIAFRLLSLSASRAERIGLVVLMGVALFLVKMLVIMTVILLE